jgi:monofunctional biosynthetic peptidoglycan transglycosylase
MTIRYWQGLDGGRQLHVWKPFEELGETMLLAIVAVSDPSFLEEGGLNPDAVKAAVEEGDAGTLGTTALGKLAARELFAWESESLAPRALTAFFSLVAEVSWSKRRIVEVYANLAEFGPGLYGAEAAAQAWYGRSAKELGDVEAAKLAACLADPLHSDPNQPDAGLAARANRILDTMQRMGGTARLREALPPPKSARD